jgi:CTP synthase (UTP-ammonia lyase)
MTLRIAILADYSDQFEPHVKTNSAFDHLREQGNDVEHRWIDTDKLPSRAAALLEGFDGLLVGGGSPFRDFGAVLRALRYARENNLPTIGTCAGYTHMTLEYARHALFPDAISTQYEGAGGTPVVDLLECSLRGKTLPIRLIPSSKAARAYGCTRVEELYYCRYGVLREAQLKLSEAGLAITGIDDDTGAGRIVELSNHPFYIGTAFVPQALSTPDRPHPLLQAFVRAAGEGRRARVSRKAASANE